MKNLRFHLTLLGGALLMMAFTSIASAQATRTWVSGVGDDANPCSRTAPCKTFAGAISKTAPGGEIDCLDPGGFGAVTITKSITIDCDAGAGGVLNAGFNGIIISAGANDTIMLRNLNIQGGGANGNGGNPAGLDGIRLVSARMVHLEDVVIMNQANGINVVATAATNLSGRDVKINNCTQAVMATDSGGNAILDFDNTQMAGNTTGVFGAAGSIITVRNSQLSLNNTGVFQSAAGSQVNLLNSEVSSNTTGVFGIAGSTIRIVGNTFTQNGTAVGAGTVLSDGTNTNAGNGIVGGVGALPAPIKF
jgi:hypothetical protein